MELGRNRATCWLLFAGRVKGRAGDVVAPAGKPEMATVTESEKPFSAAVETVKAELELPATAVIVPGETLMVKSLGPGLGGGADALPQPINVDNQNAMQTNRSRRTVAGGGVARRLTNYIQPFSSAAGASRRPGSPRIKTQSGLPGRGIMHSWCQSGYRRTLALAM